MSRRALIVGLIGLATIGFVVGATIERNATESHAESPAASLSESSAESPSAGGEFQPFGVNIEAVPFIVLAALASLAMAAAVWARPRSPLVLGAVALVMVVFAALDVREVVHQIDENRTGLAVLAGVIAGLHLAAAAAIASTAATSRPSHAEARR
jgi:hypothetical protein